MIPRLALLVIAAAPLVACSTTTGGARLAWRETTMDASRAVPVSAGDVVRIETDVPVRIGERFGGIDVFRVEEPRGHAVLTRAPLGARAVILPPGVDGRVLTLHAAPRERGGFDLEDDLRAWASGPWRAPPKTR